jgi:hypothetical protein
MKKASKSAAHAKGEEVLPHYDFTGAERGKHYKKYREGINIRILESGKKARLIVLDDDLSKIFPDSESVNLALRHVIAAVPKTKRRRAAQARLCLGWSPVLKSFCIPLCALFSKPSDSSFASTT